MKKISEYEESDFFSDARKLSRQERKRASQKDRSKYKKTDQDKIQEKLKQSVGELEPHLRQGVVISSHGQEVTVASEDKLFICTLRGLLKKEKARIKNLVIVGDQVLFDEYNAITTILARERVLSRADHLSQKKEHFIAANVDQVLITVSLVDPPLRLPLIDRYLIAAHKGSLEAIIICNKVDLLHDASYDEVERHKQLDLLKACKAIYPQIGVPFIEVSAKDGEGMQALIEAMKDKISVFSGQSGSGKSSIINAICGLNLKVGKTVESSRKGAHTTSLAKLIPLPFGGYVVDTPGIKSFGVWNITRDDVRTLFFEIAECGKNCKFQDCFHRGELGCSIPEAIDEGKVSPLRYESYLNLLASIESEHMRR